MTDRSPGNWEVWGDGAVRVIDPNVRDYGSPIVRTLVAGDPRNPHRMADARLIAAAPDLLEALKAAYDFIASEYRDEMSAALNGEPFSREARPVIAAIVDAIAKATGGVND